MTDAFSGTEEEGVSPDITLIASIARCVVRYLILLARYPPVLKVSQVNQDARDVKIEGKIEAQDSG